MGGGDDGLVARFLEGLEVVAVDLQALGNLGVIAQVGFE